MNYEGGGEWGVRGIYGDDFVIMKCGWVGTTYNQVNVKRKSCTRSCTAERGKEGESTYSSQFKEDSAQESHMTDDSRAHHRVSRDSTKKVAVEKEGKQRKRKRLFSLFTYYW
jgi:hypothetical protein